MNERIQKILSARGVCSRRHAEELIRAGRVTCNGATCVIGDTADPQVDTICVDGKPIPAGDSPVYILLHKPRGYVTTLSDEKGRKDVSLLVADCGVRVYPVGRLDMDSEGLLLLTNDGSFANKMMHPSHEVNKTYCVTVKGYTEAGLERLKKPIELDGYIIKTPEVALVHPPKTEGGTAVLSVTIHEGRNRQVRRMCDAAGMQVMRLVRVSEGSLKLGNLKVGTWRYLTRQEIDDLQK